MTFMPLSPQELAAKDSAFIEPRVSLADLAACVTRREEVQQVAERLYSLASETGPLFAMAREGLTDWAYAASSANLAVMLQEVATGARAVDVLNTRGSSRVVVKYYFLNAQKENCLTMFHVRLSMSGTYYELFGKRAYVRRLRQADGFFYYVFAIPIPGQTSGPDSISSSLHFGLVDIFAVRIEHEISFKEYSRLKRAFSDIPGVQVEELDALDGPVEKSGILEDDGNRAASDRLGDETYIPSRGILEPSDQEAMRAIVQMIVTVHLAGISVDVFRGERDTGYLVFDNFLSYLWLDFERTSDKALLGYCAQCGKAFSLVGHRGVKRIYCSDACRVEAKNEANRHKTEEVRKRFLDGQNVESIALAVYEVDEKGPIRVRAQLASWVQLKHMLEESIEHDGPRDSQLLQRCKDEGIPMERLLSKKSLKLLHRYIDDR